MSQDDLDGENLLRATRARLRQAEIPAAVRRRILFRLAGLLRVGHERLEELLRESPREVEEELLYEKLFEVAVRNQSLDELDMLLRMGASEALGVSVAEHGERVAALVSAPRPEAAEVRPIPGAGVLEDLMGKPERLLLGEHHGPSTVCPACTSFALLEDQGVPRKSKNGVHSRHRIHCSVCAARGEVERYYSFRLRGNQDRVVLLFPGILGPLATRRWAQRSGMLCLVLALGLAVLGIPWEPALLLGMTWLIRSQELGVGWELGVSVLAFLTAGVGLLQDPHVWWLAVLAITLVNLLHGLWVLVRRPTGWESGE